MRVSSVFVTSVVTFALFAPVPGCGGGSNGNGDDNGAGTSATGGSSGGKRTGGTGGAAKGGSNNGTSGQTGTSGQDNAGTGDTAGTGNTGPGEPVAEATVDPTGGSVRTEDKSVTIDVPAGAVMNAVTITVAPDDAPPVGGLGKAYEIGPSGTVFATPVTIMLSYAGLDLGAIDESTLRLATYGDLGWQILAGAKLDETRHTVSGLTSHLSLYGIVSSSGGAACANATLDATCSGAAGGPAGGSGAQPSSGNSTSCPVPTCADATDVCADYPGSTMSDCHDDPSLGVATSCCFPPEAPLCFRAGRSSTCSGAAGGPGAGAGADPQCPDVPTCANTADACANYPGATFKDCAENATGYSGSCCFDPGAPVCKLVTISGCAPSCPPPRCADGDPCGSLPGTTVSDCVDGDHEFTATCCFPVGTLPPTPGASGGGTGTAGGSTGGTGTGTSSGGDTGSAAGPGAGGTSNDTGGTSDSGGAPSAAGPGQ